MWAQHGRVRSALLRSGKRCRPSIRTPVASWALRTIDQRYNGMVIPGDGFPSSANGRVPEADFRPFNDLFRGVPNHYSDIQWGDFQPRIGIAYQLNDKTVLRAGGGRFFTRLGVSDSIFLGGNPPFQPNASVSNRFRR